MKKILYYTAELSYETKTGSQLTSFFSGIGMEDVIEWVKMMAEWLDDYSYTLIRADIRCVQREDIDEA